MLYNSVFIFLPAASAAVLWLIPGTRKNNNSWMIALKAVPCGIIVFALTAAALTGADEYFRELYFSNTGIIPHWVSLVLPFAAALTATFAAGVTIDRRAGTGNEYSFFPSFILFFPGLILTAFWSSVLSMVLAFGIFSGSGNEWRTVYLPETSGVRLAFEEQSIHPFLAEYNDRIRFFRDGQQRQCRLFTNTGGRTHFNLYALQEEGKFLFQEKHWDYLVDVTQQKIYRLEIFEERIYSAPLSGGEIDSWSGPYRKNGKVVMENGDHIRSAADVTDKFKNLRYYGCIMSGKFFPAAERPRSAVKYLRESAVTSLCSPERKTALPLQTTEKSVP